jgi:hypothetical protein
VAQGEGLSSSPSTTKKKKKEILTYATIGMNLEDITVSKISQSEKDIYTRSLGEVKFRGRK